MTSETTPIFQIKPARRQTVNCADDCPSMLCSQPYKYCVKIATVEEIQFILLIQKDNSSNEYSPLQHGLRTQPHTAEEPNTQAFLVQFMFSSFLKGKRKFKLQIASQDGKRILFESSSFFLNARKKPEQDVFWKEVRCGIKRKRTDDNDDDSKRIKFMEPMFSENGEYYQQQSRH